MSAAKYRLLTRVKTRPGTARTPRLAINLAGPRVSWWWFCFVEATSREAHTCISAGCKVRFCMAFVTRQAGKRGFVAAFACKRHEPPPQGTWTPARRTSRRTASHAQGVAMTAHAVACRRYYYGLRVRGLCWMCGGTREPLRPTCAECREARRVEQRERRAVRRADERRAA